MKKIDRDFFNKLHIKIPRIDGPNMQNTGLLLSVLAVCHGLWVNPIRVNVSVVRTPRVAVIIFKELLLAGVIDGYGGIRHQGGVCSKLGEVVHFPVDEV